MAPTLTDHRGPNMIWLFLALRHTSPTEEIRQEGALNEALIFFDWGARSNPGIEPLYENHEEGCRVVRPIANAVTLVTKQVLYNERCW